MSDALADNTALGRFEFELGDVSADMARAIGKALGANRRLREFIIKWEHFDRTGSAAIADAFDTNTTLQHIEVPFSDGLDIDDALKIDKYIKMNKELYCERRRAYKALLLGWVRANRNGDLIDPMAWFPKELLLDIAMAIPREIRTAKRTASTADLEECKETRVCV